MSSVLCGYVHTVHAPFGHTRDQLGISLCNCTGRPKISATLHLKDVLELDYLYESTKPYYGLSGQKSIDPVVFFKLCLVGYLENIISDRDLIQHSSMRLDILFFIGYDIDEPLPWHSTISRTRQLYPETVFEAVFTKVLLLCIDKGMVSGHTQAIDSAPIKANASIACYIALYGCLY